MKLGIAGYMGAGKSLGADYLAETFGWVKIDADKEAKKLMSSSMDIIQAIESTFGVVHEGVIDSAQLGAIVFSSQKQLLRLNAIVHPPLIEHLKSVQATCEQEGKISLLDGALLPLWDESALVDSGIWVSAPVAQRLERLVRRTALSTEIVSQRIEAQEHFMPPPASAVWEWLSNDDTILQLQSTLRSWGELVK